MTAKRKQSIRALLEAIETGDPAAVAVVSTERYVQHNPQTHEGSAGLAELFAELAKSSPRVDIVRLFADGDYVFGHTEYDFGSPRIGFEVFRFDGEQAIEHWDNIQPRHGPNPSGHGMVDGPVDACDLERTEDNRETVRCFVAQVLVGGELDKLERYVGADFTEHNPRLADGIAALRAALSEPAADGDARIRYQRNHRVLAEGNFVLAVSEGSLDGIHSAFYDLFRLADGRLVEHWDTTEAIPPRSEWKNDNGKF